MTKKVVMVVDDDAANRMILKFFLEADYDVVEMESGAACLEAVSKSAPDLILLDINMPGMSGYEVCNALRHEECSKTLPIVFVSGLETPEERLAGFEAGGNGFLVKPVEEDQIKEVVAYQLAHRKDLDDAQKNSEEAMKVAMEAMTSNSELGQMIQFVKDSQQEMTLEGVGRRLCEVTAAFGLNSCAVVYGKSPAYVNCEEGSVEANLLLRAKGSSERIISKGVRTIICSDHIAILVKDMPVDDDSRYGRFKDHLVVLASICDGRLLTIQAQLDMSAQRHGVLSRVISMTEEQVKKLSQKFTEHDELVHSTMMSLTGELEAKLFSLGLEEDQEEELMKLAYQATERLDSVKNDSKELEKELGAVLEGLYEILGANH